MTITLRELIRGVRATKSAAEERGAIQKELALIRTAIKDERSRYRHRNVAKLLYVHMLGYPTHFGQMECVKLISARSYAEKRIGYLALMLLLDERQEVLTLVTNSIDKDLRSSDPLVVGLALASLGNIGSEEMCRDLVPPVEECLRAKNPYIRKKAALASIRMLTKAPDLCQGLVPRIIGLLTDGSHSVLLTGVTAIGHILELRPSYTVKFSRLVPALCKILRKLATASFAGEYTIGGVTDPFLQAKILGLLRVLGKGNASASEAMADILGHVATSTPVARNAGNAILYEAVRTMMGVESEPVLHAVSVNILINFLSHKDNNIRYVALQTLNTAVALAPDMVGEHLPMVVECLRDPDVSIRRRALDLVVALVRPDNVVAMVGEMLNYLIVADADSRPELCSKIAATASKFSPSLEWQANVLVAVLALAGDVASRAIFAQFIHLVTRADTGLQARITHRLFAKAAGDLRSPDLRLALLQAAVWCTGECGATLTTLPPPGPTGPASGSDMVGALIGGSVAARSEEEVADLLGSLLTHHLSDGDTKGMVLSAALKLSGRFTSPPALAALRTTLGSLTGSLNTELQQRAVEFSAIAGAAGAGLRAKLLEAIPALDSAVLNARSGVVFDAAGGGMTSMSTTEASASEVTAARAAAREAAEARAASAAGATSVPDDDLFDLLGVGGGSTPTPASTPAPAPAPAGGGGLDDLFGPTPTATAPAPAPAPAPPAGGLGGLDDLFGTPAPAPAPAPAASSGYGPVTLMEDAAAGLRVTAVFNDTAGPSGHGLSAVATFTNTGSGPLGGVMLQVAVPRGMTCSMGPAAAGSLAPGGSATQTMDIVNPFRGTKRLALKVRVAYTPAGGAPAAYTAAVRDLAPGL